MADEEYVDLNGDGYKESIVSDEDGDGNYDTVVSDTDGDGYADTIFADTDGDGNIDTIGVDTDGDGTIDENASNDEFNTVGSFNTIQNSIESNDDFSKPEFSDGSESVDEDSSNVIKEVEEVKVKPKKKINITLVVIIGIVLLFGGVILLMNQGTSGNNVFQGEGEGEEETIVVKTGTEWGNKYLAYMMKEKPNLTTYEISFVNVNTSSEPEMFLKYKDNNGVDTLKMLYIA